MIYRYWPAEVGRSVLGAKPYYTGERRSQRLWTRLPLPAASLLGPIVRRGLPFL